MFRILTFPFHPEKGGFDDSLLDRFLLNKQLVSWKAEFFQEGGRSYWTVFLFCDPLAGGESPPPELDLNGQAKAFFHRLKEWRKGRAEKEGVPVFLVANNRELGEIARTMPQTLEALKTVKGFGAAKLEKYGKDILQLVQGFQERT